MRHQPTDIPPPTKNPVGQARRRLRMLVFAARSDDAQAILQRAQGIEIAFLPSHDIEEIVAEMTQFKPQLVACRTDFFLAALSSSLTTARPRAEQDVELIPSEKTMPQPVTPRQAKILAMLIRGSTNNQMARALNLSARTIKRELNNLFARFGASNRTELSNRTAHFPLLKKEPERQ